MRSNLALVDLDAAQLRADAREHPEQALQRPHPAHRAQLAEEVLEVELAGAQPLLELAARRARRPRARPSRSASARRPCRGSAAPCGRGGSARTASSFSPVEANRIGLPVTARTDSAAPPRASPSSLVRTTPSRRTVGRELLGDVDRVLAGHRVDDEQHLVGLDRLARSPTSSAISSASTCRRPAVSTISTSLPSVRVRSSAQRAISTGATLGALLVDGRAGALAEHDELLDGRRALRCRRPRARPSCGARCASSARASPPPSSCPSPAGRPS